MCIYQNREIDGVKSKEMCCVQIVQSIKFNTIISNDLEERTTKYDIEKEKNKRKRARERQRKQRDAKERWACGFCLCV